MADRGYDEEDELLAASRQAYKSHAGPSHKAMSAPEAFTDGTDLVMFDQDDAEIPPELAPKAKKERPAKASTSKSTSKKKLVEPANVTQSLETLENTGVVSTKKPSKRQVQEYRSKSAGPAWYDMPAFPGAKFSNKKDARTEAGKASFTGGDARSATEKEMRRQVTAIRLRNALDPTRFYRGSGGTGADRGMPPYAQLGTIVGGGLEPASIVPRKQRADTVVGELVNDARSVAYSRKKFNEVCCTTNSASREAHGDRQAEPVQTRWPATPQIIDRVPAVSTWGPRGDERERPGISGFSLFFVFFCKTAARLKCPEVWQIPLGGSILALGRCSAGHPCLPAP